MIRIIFFSLLTLTLSCGNTRPEPASGVTTDSVEIIPAEAAPVVETPAVTTPEPAPRASAPARRAPRVRKAAETPKTDNTETVAQAAIVAEAIPIASPVVEEQPAEAAADTATETTVVETPPAAPTFAFTPEQTEPGKNKHFLPTRRRIDRDINKIKFAYKGEVIMGMTASYGTLSSDDSDIMLILDNIDASGTIASVKPFIGYFYRDNNCVGVRFGYNHMSGTLDNLTVDAGSSNDINLNVPYLDLKSNNFSFGVFHRSYAGLDPKGRFGLFAEFELSVSTGSSEFAHRPDDDPLKEKRYFSDNTQLKLSFNPGAAVYIFPNVCATLSFGLGGLQYTSVKQKDADGNVTGRRRSSNMKFKLNIAAINIGMTIHMWDKKKK